jgi:hypothetical protein
MQYNSRFGNAAPTAPNVDVINLPAAFRHPCHKDGWAAAPPAEQNRKESGM